MPGAMAVAFVEGYPPPPPAKVAGFIDMQEIGCKAVIQNGLSVKNKKTNSLHGCNHAIGRSPPHPPEFSQFSSISIVSVGA